MQIGKQWKTMKRDSKRFPEASRQWGCIKTLRRTKYVILKKEKYMYICTPHTYKNDWKWLDYVLSTGHTELEINSSALTVICLSDMEWKMILVGMIPFNFSRLSSPIALLLSLCSKWQLQWVLNGGEKHLQRIQSAVVSHTPLKSLHLQVKSLKDG